MCFAACRFMQWRSLNDSLSMLIPFTYLVSNYVVVLSDRCHAPRKMSNLRCTKSYSNATRNSHSDPNLNSFTLQIGVNNVTLSVSLRHYIWQVWNVPLPQVLALIVYPIDKHYHQTTPLVDVAEAHTARRRTESHQTTPLDPNRNNNRNRNPSSNPSPSPNFYPIQIHEFNNKASSCRFPADPSPTVTLRPSAATLLPAGSH